MATGVGFSADIWLLVCCTDCVYMLFVFVYHEAVVGGDNTRWVRRSGVGGASSFRMHLWVAAVVNVQFSAFRRQPGENHGRKKEMVRSFDCSDTRRDSSSCLHLHNVHGGEDLRKLPC